MRIEEIEADLEAEKELEALKAVFGGKDRKAHTRTGNDINGADPAGGEAGGSPSESGRRTGTADPFDEMKKKLDE